MNTKRALLLFIGLLAAAPAHAASRWIVYAATQTIDCSSNLNGGKLTQAGHDAYCADDIGVSSTTAAATYETIADATTTYLSKSSATVTYLYVSSATAYYITLSSTAATYLQSSSATATYLQIAAAAATYLTLSSAAVTYPSTATAASTYLAKSSATATYLQLSSAAVTYPSTDTVSSTYLAKSSATATYLQISSAAAYYELSSHASATYLPTATAASTYLAISSAAVTYPSTDTVSSTYLTKSSATATYLQITPASLTYTTVSSMTTSSNTWTAGQILSTANVSNMVVTQSTVATLTVSGHLRGNSSAYITSDHDLYLAHTISGSAAYVQIYNGSNTGSSAAELILEVAGASAGNPYINFTIDTANNIATIGENNADSDAFVMSNGATLGTNNWLRADHTSGEVAISTFSSPYISQATGTWITVSTLSVNGSVIQAPAGTNGKIYTLPTAAPASAATILTTNSTQTVTAHLELQGTLGSEDPAPGFVGEIVSSTTASNINFGASGSFSDMLSTNTTGAGSFLVTGIVCLALNGATMTTFEAAVSKNSGSSVTGLAYGDNRFAGPTTLNDYCIYTTEWKMNVSGATTVYLKFKGNYSVATPQAYGGLKVKRIR